MAEILISALQLWALLGLLVAVPFLLFGIDRIDEDARGAYAFRPLLLPAILVIWPLVLWRWGVLETGTDRWWRRYTPPRGAHGVAAVVMGGLIVVALAAGFAIRQDWPADIAPERLSAPEESG